MLCMAEIWSTYWESKGKYHYQIWGKLDQHSRSYKGFYALAKSNFCHAYRVNHFKYVKHQRRAFW